MSKASVFRIGVDRIFFEDCQCCLTRHLLDRASQRCLDIWARQARNGEGLASWIARQARMAYNKGERDEQGYFILGELRFAIDDSDTYPVANTVITVSPSGLSACLLDHVRSKTG